MKSLEELKDAADRAFVLLEQKSPHQLAVELVSMEDRVQGAIDACARMQEQRDQLAFQLKDATSQCAVAADLLRELREGAEIHLHNCIVCKNELGIANWTSKLERIDAALSGKLPAPAVPEGWQLVPHTPTSEMCAAFHKADSYWEDGWAFDDNGNRHNSPVYQWVAMLAAAPKPEGGA